MEDNRQNLFPFLQPCSCCITAERRKVKADVRGKDHLAEIPKEFALMRSAFFRTEKFFGTSVPGIDGLNGALKIK
ncbi:MAG: hypothetical protein ACTHPD_11680 [Rhizomicrobium sp.]